MDLSNLRPADGSKQSDNFRTRQPEKATKDRKPVQAVQDRDLKAVRCLCTEEYRREVSHAETLRRS